jgi:hypothetical protein
LRYGAGAHIPVGALPVCVQILAEVELEILRKISMPVEIGCPVSIVEEGEDPAQVTCHIVPLIDADAGGVGVEMIVPVGQIHKDVRVSEYTATGDLVESLGTRLFVEFLYDLVD